MSNSTTALLSYNGVVLQNVSGVQISRQGGGESVAIRGLTADRRPIGWRHGQREDYQITFTVVQLEDGLEVDWIALQKSKEQFTLSEVADTYQRNFLRCVVQSCDESIGDDGTPSLSVVVGALDDDYSV